jgi:hypothetical protein
VPQASARCQTVFGGDRLRPSRTVFYMAITLEKRIVSAQVPGSMREALERLAEREDRTLSAEVRRALSEHLERCRPSTTLKHKGA